MMISQLCKTYCARYGACEGIHLNWGESFECEGFQIKKIINFGEKQMNNIEITVKVNGKVARLSDVSDETLLNIWRNS